MTPKARRVPFTKGSRSALSRAVTAIDHAGFESVERSYAGTQVIETPTYEWQHTLGDIVTALIDAGLRIEFLHEFPFTCCHAYPVMERGDDGWWQLPKHNDSFPQMFSIRASKQGMSIILAAPP